MNFAKSLLGGIAVLLLSLPTFSNAQTVVFKGIGSSALFLELGQAASQSSATPYYPEACVWSSNSSTVTDNSTYGGGRTETGNKIWATWNPGSGSCSSPSGTVYVSYYVSADSVVGNRCLFNSCTLTAVGSGGANVLGSGTDTVTTLPTAISGAIINSVVNAAGTDIRPEDAKFAINRALTSCGTSMGTATYGSVSTTQYEGLGYSNGDSIQSYYGGSFKVINFNLPSTSSALNFNVIPVGAAPVVVAVNSTDTAPAGFANSNIIELNRSTLALYLDGSIGYTGDAMEPGTTQTGSANKSVTVLIREPLSGTYNTMEYSIPNSLELQTSQDVGFMQPSGQKNCSGTSPLSNPLNIGNTNFGSYRNRAIGTGQELSELFSINNALGYGFWSVANFKNAPTTAKYLTIDGVDPIENNYNTNGAIPTPSTGVGPSLTNVTFAHIIDGKYPIWSLLRLVTTGSSSAASSLATAAQSYSTSTYPDFVPYTSLKVERSHFAPLGVTIPTPQNGVCGDQDEIGGDVGGVVIPCQVDYDYYTTTGNTYINHRL